MIKKPDLKIDTQFFDDNLNGLHIPEAIRITQSIDTQTFIKEGLSDEVMDGSTIIAIEAIEKIISQRLCDNFLACWTKLKENTIPRFSSESTPNSQKIHRRQNPHIANASDEYETASNVNIRGMERQKVGFRNIRARLQGDSIQWLQQQRRNIKSKSILRQLSQGKATSAESHYERAKVLKQIVDKLKYGRQAATGFIDLLESNRENQQLHHKLNKLEKMMESFHQSGTQRAISVSEKKSASNSQVNQRQIEDYQSGQMEKLRRQLLDVKIQMQNIRRTNQQILREQQWKKSQISKLAILNSQIQYQYETLQGQLGHLERQKHTSSLNNMRLEQQLMRQSSQRQQFEQKMQVLSQKYGQAERNERLQGQKVGRAGSSVDRSIVPIQTNPFGYSTFTFQKNSGAITGSWEQSTKPVGSAPWPIQINEDDTQRVCGWGCF